MKVVIMDEPTKGVDVGAKAEIYAIMGELAKKGYGIIMISSEMPEIIGMCDRIYVMCKGRITGCLNRNEATQESILQLLDGKRKHEEGGGTGMKQKSVLKQITKSREFSLVIVLIVLCVVATILNPSFISPTNMHRSSETMH